ncbi:MAG: class I SAM-dependent methyltransferase [Candidatus Dormibacteria bacterium]
MPDWHDDDLFWESFGPAMFNPARIERAAGEAEDALSLLRVSPGDHLLDVCCGAGRHAVEFARRGFSVTGVDRTRVYLDQAGDRARAEGVEVELVEADVRGFRRPGAFHGAVCLYTSFGFFADREDDMQLLRNVRASLRPGGCFVLEMMGKEVLADLFQARTWHETEEGVLLEEAEVVPPWEAVRTRWIFLPTAGGRHQGTFQLRLYSAVELRAAMLDSGFESVEFYGDLGGSPYDNEAEKLVAVAEVAS